MPIEILMPALSPTMEEGKLAKWMKAEGDIDKATMEVEAVDEGRMGKILVPAGTEGVKVNTPIATLIGEDEKPGDAPAAKADAKPAGDAAVAPPPKQAASDAAPAEKDVAPASGGTVPAQPKSAEPATDPDVPEGTEMVTMTVREALRDAMAEEMRRDGDVFVMGEEVAEYQGAYKITQGLLQEFGERRVIDTPITEHGFAGLAAGAAMAGL
jgi:pyruvate dehydrogenase E1 component beta subunit